MAFAFTTKVKTTGFKQPRISRSDERCGKKTLIPFSPLKS